MFQGLEPFARLRNMSQWVKTQGKLLPTGVITGGIIIPVRCEVKLAGILADPKEAGYRGF